MPGASGSVEALWSVLVGREVDRVVFDRAVTLVFEGGAELRLECAFGVVERDGVTQVDPGAPVGGSAAVLGILGRVVVGVAVTEAGAVRVEIADGTVLECAADPDVEAWTLSGPSGLLVVSVPGGTVAQWPGGPVARWPGGPVARWGGSTGRWWRTGGSRRFGHRRRR
ncbi:DUF6188 family protein [Cellulomonas triticagri]|uniref:DUF6188 family protein n=1 Tax=Cellulomonas triticagri TaxID=2483352 RepID=UPI001315A367|nr:DUF6188 family protein [Cellulomonas triticagri]